ncbi:hypothetical protein [Polynucleobacter necessarius]|uniref:hypothetical protein n=1 Tax=Polynucleobacter necessarius TaxID=576610 RepID=UPI0039E5775A
MGVGIAAGFIASGANTIILGRSADKALTCLNSVKACAESMHSEWGKDKLHITERQHRRLARPECGGFSR